MVLMQRWQLKQSAKEQLRGKWGNMALKSFLVSIIPSGILWAAMLVFGTCFAVNTILPGAQFGFGSFDLYATGINGLAAVGIVLLIIAYLCVLIVKLALDFGFNDACIKLRSGEVTGAGAIFGRFNMLPRILMYTLLVVLICLPYIAVELLSSFFPGTVVNILSFFMMLAYIYIALRLSMSVYILLENPYTTAWTSLKQSWYIMRGHCWRFFVLNLSFLGWILLACLSLGIGMFWLLPYMSMTSVYFYYNIKEACLNTEQQ